MPANTAPSPPWPSSASASKATLGLALAACFLVVLLSRLLVLSSVLNDWDAVQYAAALEDYDISRERPHGPGYPLLVGAGKAFHAMGFGPEWALGAPNAVYSAAAVLCFWGLLGAMGLGRWRTLLAAALATSPLLWYCGSLASAHPCEILMSTLVAWSCWHHLSRREERGAPGTVAGIQLGGLLGVSAGFRPQLGVFLLPLVVYAFWRSRARWTAWTAAALAGASVCLAWGIPVVLESGGVRGLGDLPGVQHSYYVYERSILFGNVAWAVRNLIEVGIATVCGLGGLALLLPMLLIRRRGRGETSGSPGSDREVLWFCAIWALPFLAFFLLLFFTRPGFLLPVLPPAYVLVAVAINRRPGLPWRGLLLAAVGVSLAFFLLAPGQKRPVTPLTDLRSAGARERVTEAVRKLAGRFLVHTRDRLRVQETIIQNYRECLTEYDPETTLVAVEFEMDFTWRQAAWYLSEYEVWGMTPKGWRRHQRGVYEAPQEPRGEVVAPPGILRVAWIGLHPPEMAGGATLKRVVPLQYERTVRVIDLRSGVLRSDGFALRAAFPSPDSAPGAKEEE